LQKPVISIQVISIEEDVMARIPGATRESVPSDQQAAFDQAVNERGGVPSGGPASIMINVPEIANRGSNLSAYLRGGSTLSSRIQELAMLVTAREKDARYIWNAHAGAGRRAGLRDDIVDNLRERREIANLAPDEAAVVSLGQEFFRTHKVSQATFDAAIAQFGTRGLIELTNLMGYYALLAFNLNAFDVELPEERTEPVLPV
jgi:4-carboxymuconolactone decarboxylase